jgi:D-sedoheptulose 7-phosphate isomerase
MSYINIYLEEVKSICDSLDRDDLEKFSRVLKDLKGRCFIIGMGGSAANCSHLINDLRKLCNIDACSPLDNVSELTARINDDGWDTCISNSLEVSKINEDDCLLVLSVGGGSDTTSQPLVNAMQLAANKNAKIISIVSRDGGKARQMSDACVLIPIVDEKRITPHAEEFQGIIWHMIINYIIKDK